MHEIDPNLRYRMRNGQPAEVFMIDTSSSNRRPVIGAGQALAGNWHAAQWDCYGFTENPNRPSHTDLILETDDDVKS